jgi:hypothetical protein
MSRVLGRQMDCWCGRPQNALVAVKERDFEDRNGYPAKSAEKRVPRPQEVRNCPAFRHFVPEPKPMITLSQSTNSLFTAHREDRSQPA